MMIQASLAVVWLNTPSDCAISQAEVQEKLYELSDQVELIYCSPGSLNNFPDEVDCTIIAGAVGNNADIEGLQRIRESTHILISVGDYAVFNRAPVAVNSPSVRPDAHYAYLDAELVNPDIPGQLVPPPVPKLRAVHSVVSVDFCIPGCPPNTRGILHLISELFPRIHTNMNDRTQIGV